MTTYIALRISGLEMSHDEITAQLKIASPKISKKGEIVNNKKYKLPPTIVQEDSWMSGFEPYEHTKPQDALEDFVMRFKPSFAYLKSLSKKYSVTVWVSLCPEKEQFNMHVTSKAIKALNEMGATLDCTMMFLQAFYEGDYHCLT